MVLPSMAMQFITARSLLPLVACGALACGGAAASRGQQPDAGRGAAAFQPKSTDYLGPERCEGCHTAPTQSFINRGALEYVRLDEFQRWRTQDKHAVAYQKLLAPPAKRIGELLRIDAASDQSCLGCHANWRADLPRPDDDDLQEGVSCESCHGPSRNWLVDHSERAWRTRPADEKTALGMINVRDPLVRARQCLSCHVGDQKQGKVLTHEMYAAGHPPLPGIELESFVEQMPRHWRYLDEKDMLPEEERRQLRELLGQPPGSLHRAKGVLVGGVMALRQSLDLLETDGNRRQSWPDFARFDCAMCHHELQSPSWRQSRGSGGRLGRPQLAVWPASLVEAGIAGATGGEQEGPHPGPLPEYRERENLSREFQQRLARLNDAFTVQPFGDPAQIGRAGDPRSTSGDLARWLDQLAERINRQPCDRAASLAALRQLCQLSSQRPPDYDSARQMAWAFRTLYQELNPPPSTAARVQEVLTALGQELQLQLPTRQQDGVSGESISGYEAIGRYDPQRFRELMEILAKALTDDGSAK